MIDLTSDKIRTDVVKRKFYDEDDSFFEELKITREEYALYPSGINKYLIELSDGYYYAKRVTEFQLCNEIVGRYLGNKIGLDTTSLEILFDKGKVKAATPNYKKKDVTYRIPKNDIKLMGSDQYNVDNLKLLPREYQEEQIKLIALDIMMEQIDRYDENMEEIITNNSVELAPLIDFERSFNRHFRPEFSYSNPYVCLPKNIKDIDKFLNDFIEAYQYFIEMFSTEEDELLNYIEDNYPIKVSDRVIWKYDSVIFQNEKILTLIK